MSEAVAFHPERVPGDPAALRWVFPDGAPPAAATALQRLVDAGTLSAVAVEADAVVTTLAGGSWRQCGPAVRDALSASATDSSAATPPTTAPLPHDDAALRLAVEEVLAGPAGAYVGSHGGRASLVHVSEGVVTLRLGGACSHCPAAGITVASTLEREIRVRYPALVEVRRG